MSTNNTISFFLWNARSLTSRLPEFQQMLNHFRPLVVCLVETWFTSATHCIIPGYVLHRADRIGRRRGGVAILIQEGVAHHRVSFTVPPGLEAIAVRLHSRHQQLTIVSVYLPPNAPFPATSLSLLTKLDSNLVLAGDFNCRHTLWGCNNITWRGKCLATFLDEHHLTVHSPFSPTYIPDNSKFLPTILDLLLSSRPWLVQHVTTFDKLNSDHLPVVGLLCFTPDFVSPRKIYDYKRASWQKYQRVIDSSIQLGTVVHAPEDVEILVTSFTQSIVDAAKSAIPLVPSSRRGPPFPKHLRKLLAERNAARKRWQHTRSTSDKDCYKILYFRCKSAIREWTLAQARHRIASLSTVSGSLWRFVKRLKFKHHSVPSLSSNDTLYDSAEDKAELLAQHFSRVFQMHSDLPQLSVLPQDLHEEILNSEYQLSGSLCSSPREVAKVIDHLHISAAPGHDDLPVRLIRALSRKAVIFLAGLFNVMFRMGYYPITWKHSIIVPILKTSSPATAPSSYRPIALLSVLAKVFDQLIEHRLRQHAESFQILPLHQFGFRKNHSATHAVARLVHQVTTGFNNGEHTILVLIDFHKAFDSVPHAALIRKLHSFNVPLPLLRLLLSFLTQRSFQVRVDGICSNVFPVQAGVPQGSSLSPLLFALYTADISLPWPLRLQLYADDTSISCSGRMAVPLVARIQGGLRLLLDYANRWGLRPNPDKTQAIFLTRRRNFLPPKLWFLSKSLQWQVSVTYLGVTLDRSLTWLEHSARLADRANRSLYTLAPILRPASPIDLQSRLSLFTLYIVPVLLYAVGVWAYAARSSWRKVRTVYHRGLRLLLGRPRNTPVHDLLAESNFPPFAELVSQRTDKFFFRCGRHRNPLIASICTEDETSHHCHPGIRDYRKLYPP